MSDKRDDNRFLALLEERPRRSFYSHIRNAAILLKLHGLFPFENVRSDDGRSLSFKWLSLSVLWGFAVYTISSIVLYWLPFDEQIKKYVIIVHLYGLRDLLIRSARRCNYALCDWLIVQYTLLCYYCIVLM